MATKPDLYTGTALAITPLETEKTWKDWGSAAWDAVAMQPVWQAVGRTYDMLVNQGGDRFDPYKDDYLKGYEVYADEFINTMSRAEADSMKARIDKNNERRANIERNLGFGGLMMTELLNPVNYIPLPGLMGTGFVRGAVRGTLGFGATLAGEEALRQTVDPTATAQESQDNILYGTLFGGILSGGLGMVGAKNARELGERFAAEIRVQNAAERGTDAEPIIASQTGFTARPTTDTATGVARAGGLEKQTNITLWGRLKNSGVRAVEDFADAVAGDYGTLSARNRQGLATEQSAYLASTLWRGQAADFTRKLNQIYARYLTGGDGGMEIFGLNLATAPGKVAEFFGREARPDGKMTYEQFKEAIFRAHKQDGIKADDPFVREGATAVREFFDGAMEKGVASGAIRSAEGFKALLKRRADRGRQLIARFEELSAKTNRNMNETVELVELAAQQDRLLKWIGDRLDDELPVDEGLKAVLDELDTAATKRRAEMERTRADLIAKGDTQRDNVEQLLEGIQASIDERVAKDEALLRYFNQKEEQVGLTDAERNYRDDIEMFLASTRADGTPKQKQVLASLQDRVAQARRPANWPQDIPSTLYHGYGRDSREAVYGATAEPLLGDARYMAFERNVAEQFGPEVASETVSIANPLFIRSDADLRRAMGAAGITLKPKEMMTVEQGRQLRQWAETNGHDGIVVYFDELADTNDALIQNFGFSQAVDFKRSWGPAEVDLPPISQLDGRSFLSERQRTYLEALEKRLNDVSGRYAGPKNEANYISRVWDIDRVRHDPEGLTEILYDWFKQNPMPGASMNEGAIRRRAEEAVRQIMRESELGEMQIMKGGGASFLSSRKIDIPNELVVDYLVTDVEHIVRNYAHRFGLVHEFSRKFGSFDAEDAMDDVILQSTRELQFADMADATAQLGTLRQDMTELRDTVTGAIYSTDPAMMNKRRLAAGLRAYGTLTSLGRAALSSVPEMGRGIMVNGFLRTFGFALDILGNRAAFKGVTDELAALTGEGFDMVLSSVMDRFVEQGGPLGAATGKAGRLAQKMTNFTNGPYFLLNGLAAITDITKRLNLTFINQFMIEDMVKLAETGDAKLAERLGSYGISVEDARRIVTEMPIDRQGRMYLPNVGEWSDGDLATKYLSAVTGMSRRIVPTAGPADIPQIAKGFVAGREFPLLTMPFQFMQYGFAAINKVTLSALQGRDQSPVAGLAIIMGLGWVAQNLKTDDQQWHRMSVEEKALRVFDATGALGLYQDIPNKLEVLTGGTVGLRPGLAALGADVKPWVKDGNYADYADLAGPGVSKIADLTRIVSGDDMSGREMSGIIRRSVPLNDVIWWRDSLIEAERYAFEAAAPD